VYGNIGAVEMNVNIAVQIENARLTREVELLNERNNSNYEDTLEIEVHLANSQILLHRTLDYLNELGSCADLVDLVVEIQAEI